MPGLLQKTGKALFPEKLEALLKEYQIGTYAEKTSKGKQLAAIFPDAIIIFSFDFNGEILKVEK